jgi:hypothetical protein
MSDTMKHYVDNIEDHLKTALANAQMLQAHILETEGDSDLHRKLAFYLTPALIHWVDGAQAGNMKDLKETLNRRLANVPHDSVTLQSGDGYDVLTKPAE